MEKVVQFKIKAPLQRYLIVFFSFYILFFDKGFCGQIPSVKIGNIKISQVWTPAPPPNAKSAASYMIIRNLGSSNDTLLGGTSSIANFTMIHQNIIEDGIVKMVHVDELLIESKMDTILSSGGFHIMFMGLKKRLKPGESYTLNLNFKKSGTLKLKVPILKKAPN